MTNVRGPLPGLASASLQQVYNYWSAGHGISTQVAVCLAVLDRGSGNNATMQSDNNASVVQFYTWEWGPNLSSSCDYSNIFQTVQSDED